MTIIWYRLRKLIEEWQLRLPAINCVHDEQYYDSDTEELWGVTAVSTVDHPADTEIDVFQFQPVSVASFIPRHR